MGGSKYFSTIDFALGFWQVKMADEDQSKTAFIILKGGIYEFNVMPFGLCNTSATFQRIVDEVFEGLNWEILVVYIDDINIFSKTFEEHLQ